MFIKYIDMYKTSSACRREFMRVDRLEIEEYNALMLLENYLITIGND